MGETDSQRAGLLPWLPSLSVAQLDGTLVDCSPLEAHLLWSGCAHLFLESRQPAKSANAQGCHSWALPGLGRLPHWDL